MTDPTPSGGPEGTPPGRRSGSGGGIAKSASFSVGRGVILIAVAIVIGIVLLQLVDDGSGSKQDTSATSTTAAAASSTTTTAKNTTGTTRPITPTSEVSAIVLNGTGVSGVAKSISDKLGAAPLSYKMQTPGNADKTTGTVVYYTGDLSAEAAAMATAVNAATQGVTGVAGDAKVEQLPDPVPTSWTKDNLSKAQLVIVVGAR